MRIGINVSWMKPGHAGGMESYARNLIRELAAIDRENDYLLVTGESNDHTFEPPGDAWSVVAYLGSENSPRSYQVSLDPAGAPAHRGLLGNLRRAARLWMTYPEERLRETYRRLSMLGRPYWRGRLADLIREERLDLWFCPFMYALPMATPVPVVNTIPDLQQEHHPEFFDPQELAFRALGYRFSCLSAAATIGISRFVAEDIVRRYGVDAGKVFATPLALDPSFAVDDERLEALASRARIEFRLPPGRPFLLYPANGWRHKNHDNLVRALAVARQRGADVDLVLTGTEFDLDKRLRPLVRELGVSGNVRHLGYVGKESLLGLYAAASLLVFPSLFEGFGLPLLEAMAVGLPIACSDVGSLPEVGGEAVRYFDATRPEAIAAAVVELMASPSERRRLVAAGRERLGEFSYRRTAERTLEIFRRVGKGDLPRPALRPFRPVTPHNWLAAGFGRWYFHLPELAHVEVKIRQPTHLAGLRGQRITLMLDGVPVRREKIEPKREHHYALLAEPGHEDDLHCLEILAENTANARGDLLSVQVLSIVAVDGSERRTVLVA